MGDKIRIRKCDVREVVAVDINPESITALKNLLNKFLVPQKSSISAELKNKIKKIKPKLSDLFSNIKTKFDLIIFNPPYLPQDKGIEDPALYGGKKGYEISEKFFNQVSQYLTPKGKILFLFSSLTNKTKIDEFINNNLLHSKQLEKQHLHFEDLYVYLIKKSPLLNEFERKGIEDIHYLTHGKRGNIYTGFWNKNIFNKKQLGKKLIKVAIKTKRKESQAQNRIKNEVNWLKVINKKGLGPQLLFYGETYFVYQFVEGDFILDYFKKNNKEKTKKVLINVLKQCFVLDKMGINKEEMHHPLKHIVIDKKPVLLDFERTKKTEKPKNVTQFVEFLVRFKFLQRKKVLPLLKQYKKDHNNFNKILSFLAD